MLSTINHPQAHEDTREIHPRLVPEESRWEGTEKCVPLCYIVPSPLLLVYADCLSPFLGNLVKLSGKLGPRSQAWGWGILNFEGYEAESGWIQALVGVSPPIPRLGPYYPITKQRSVLVPGFHCDWTLILLSSLQILRKGWRQLPWLTIEEAWSMKSWISELTQILVQPTSY